MRILERLLWSVYLKRRKVRCSGKAESGMHYERKFSSIECMMKYMMQIIKRPAKLVVACDVVD